MTNYIRILFIQKNQYPWMVRIVANSTAGPFVCGATLVSSKVRLHLFREEKNCFEILIWNDSCLLQFDFLGSRIYDSPSVVKLQLCI